MIFPFHFRPDGDVGVIPGDGEYDFLFASTRQVEYLRAERTRQWLRVQALAEAPPVLHDQNDGRPINDEQRQVGGRIGDLLRYTGGSGPSPGHEPREEREEPEADQDKNNN